MSMVPLQDKGLPESFEEYEDDVNHLQWEILVRHVRQLSNTITKTPNKGVLGILLEE